ncbi:uncharacterized protein EV420DRAFT_1493959 [Desarmillaria tabescens]|uniref:Conidiation protein 6 n=1 Tax=Armillaria tabescens TaxID=1929756 RepID=A0AA39NPT9_ARMTA|nr:uncharacterized protein EV420DRAFT_1493959 [Desarmillaria tabescens]KAK0469343.1 hypothetical protein EV420DRAFT_1493959 [Desarmillaria tabescens]
MSTQRETSGKDPVRVAAGLKATVHNPNVSEEAKERATDQLQHMQEGEVDPQSYSQGATRVPVSDDDVNLSGNQRGGYKATLKNPNVSKEAKGHAREILEADQEE